MKSAICRLQAAENAAIDGGDENPKLIFNESRSFAADSLYYARWAGGARSACQVNGGPSRQQQESSESTRPMQLRRRDRFSSGKGGWQL
jgi:hypothetical protein